MMPDGDSTEPGVWAATRPTHWGEAIPRDRGYTGLIVS